MYPHNREHYKKLIIFLRELIVICNRVKIYPILEASLALFYYTRNQSLNVNDVDLSVTESQIAILANEFDLEGIKYEIKDYHVLRVVKDDVKIEFDSIDHWFKEWNINLRKDYENIKIEGITMRIIDIDSLLKTYKAGLAYGGKRVDEYKYKIQLLESIL